MPKPVLSDFAHIKRYLDTQRQQTVAKILPGEFYVTKTDELITTVLGSCISACIWDPVGNFGVMNHFRLPIKGQALSRESWQTDNSYPCRYGLWAMEYLINEILKYGGQRQRLKAKLFGGGRVLPGITTDVGSQNCQFAQDYLENEGIPIISSDLGGPFPRKVLFYPNSGKAMVKKLQSAHNDTIEQRERLYIERLSSPVEDTGKIELFQDFEE